MHPAATAITGRCISERCIFSERTAAGKWERASTFRHMASLMDSVRALTQPIDDLSGMWLLHPDVLGSGRTLVGTPAGAFSDIYRGRLKPWASSKT